MKHKISDQKAAAIVCAALFVLGIVALGVAVFMVAGAKNAAERSAQLMRELAVADAKEKLYAAGNALKRVEEANADPPKVAAEVLDALSGARASFAATGATGESAGVIEVLDWCRAQTLAMIGDTADNGAELSAVIAGLCNALDSADSGAETAQIAGSLKAPEDDGERGFASLNSAVAYTPASLRAKAAEYIGKNAALAEVDGVGFPPALVLCGENTLVAVSRARGELLELYFDRPAGEEKMSCNACAETIADFLAEESVIFDPPDGKDLVRDELCGAYFYRTNGKGGGVCIGVRWDTGRVCYYNAYDYYR